MYAANSRCVGCSDGRGGVARGFVNVVVRRGDAVLRKPGERAGFVHDLLRLLEGWVARHGFSVWMRTVGSG